MIQQENIMVTKDDYLTLQVVGYKEQGESIILSIGDKFLGVIDCFKVGEKFETKRIIKEMGIPIDFICWTHADWDHTYGLSDLKEFCTQNTAFIVSDGLQAKDIRDLFFDEQSYQHKEYKKIYSMIDDVKPKKFANADEHSTLYRFLLKYENEEIDFIMNSFAPFGGMVRRLNRTFISKLVEDINLDKNGKRELGYSWYEDGNSKNNIFSIGLEIVLKLKKQNIRICLTGDLDNDTINEMEESTIERIFSRNTILKIPHHGSKNSDGIIEFPYKNKIKFNYAICTSYNKCNLPHDEMLSKYKQGGFVFKTNCKDADGYGIVKYCIPIVSDVVLPDGYEEINCFGDAGQAL